MLQKLQIENLAIIEDLEVSFLKGLTTLTGATGAGKSLMIDSLKLLFGARADSDLIRHGKDQSKVVGLFSELNGNLKTYLESIDIKGDTLKIERVLSKNNKNQITLNDKPVTLSDLKKVTYYLGDIHEQHDITKLLDPLLQLSLIDELDKNTIEPLFQSYLILKDKYNVSLLKYKKALSEQASKESEIETFKYQAKELKDMHLDNKEKSVLIEQIEKLSHEEKIVKEVSKAYEILDRLYDSGDLYEAANALKQVSKFDELYLKSYQSLENNYYELESLRSDLKKSLDIFEYKSDQELNSLNERLYALNELEKKYQKSIPELMIYLAEIEEKILMTEDYEGYLNELKKQANLDLKETHKAGFLLHQERVKLASQLEKKLIQELTLLDLEKVRFEVFFEPFQTEPILHEDGLDIVTFMIGLNEGEPLKPLYKTASGGELSRFMLALKVIFASIQKLNLVVFDEIDMGISGKTASKVASRLKALSETMQVISITHLPQVAAMGDYQYHIEKHVKDARTYTVVNKLDLDRRIEVIAEMLSGERMDQYAISHARSLLEK